MARKSVAKNKNSPVAFKDSILEGITRLWEKHGAFAIEFAEDSDAQQVSVSFKVGIDLSKSDPITSVHIGFSQKVTDEVKFTLDDPNQGTFTELMESPGPKKGENAEPKDTEQDIQDKPAKKKKSKTEA